MWWIKQLAKLPSMLLLMMVTYLPGRLGIHIRNSYYKNRLASLGSNVTIDVGVHLMTPEFIEIGDNSWIDKGVLIIGGISSSTREQSFRNFEGFLGKPGYVHIGSNIHVAPYCIISGIDGGVFIADDCGFSAGCHLYSLSHHYRSRSDPRNRKIAFTPMVDSSRQCMVSGPVQLGTNTGVALGATILPGTKIGKDSFVVPGSIVNGGVFEDNSMISGNPAKRISTRFLDDK